MAGVDATEETMEERVREREGKLERVCVELVIPRVRVFPTMVKSFSEPACSSKPGRDSNNNCNNVSQFNN